MNYRRYLIPLGSWAAVVFGIFYLAAFFTIGYQVNLAVGIACLSLSLSIKAYGNSIENARRQSDEKGN